MEEDLIVYKISFVNTKKCYIGITNDLEARKKKHVYNANRGSNNKIHKAIRKYGNPIFEILEICKSKIELYEAEKKYISQFNSFLGGYNSTLGGEGSFGSSRKKTKEWKKNQSERMIGENNPMFGYTFSDERKKHHSQKMKDYYAENPNKKNYGNKSCSGLMWINNGVINKKIKKSEELPNGYKKGMLYHERKK